MNNVIETLEVLREDTSLGDEIRVSTIIQSDEVDDLSERLKDLNAWLEIDEMFYQGHGSEDRTEMADISVFIKL